MYFAINLSVKRNMVPFFWKSISKVKCRFQGKQNLIYYSKTNTHYAVELLEAWIYFLPGSIFRQKRGNPTFNEFSGKTYSTLQKGGCFSLSVGSNSLKHDIDVLSYPYSGCSNVRFIITFWQIWSYEHNKFYSEYRQNCAPRKV